nr:retrovirus-related Pol polyprotein from transposon TNT 1-94 [Tanacetum cinerariifolium]
MASSITRFDIEKFDWKNDFGLWQIKMCALMVQQGCDAALETLPVDIEASDKAVLMKKAYSTLILCLGDRVLRKVTKETTGAGIWTKLTSLYMTKSLANKLYMKKKLYTCTKLGDHINEFNKIILDLANVDIEIEGEDQALMLLTSLPLFYENFVERLLYGRESLTMKDGKRDQDFDSSDDEGNAYFEEALVVVGNDEITELVMDSGVSYHMTHKRDFMYDFKVVDGGSVQLGLRRSLISLGTLEKEGYTVKMQMSRIEVIKEVHGVHNDKRVWFEVELQGDQRDREAEVFQVSNDDVAVAQRRLKEKQLEEKTYTDFLVKEHEREHLGIKVKASITVTGIPRQEGAEGGPRFEVLALDEDAEY